MKRIPFYILIVIPFVFYSMTKYVEHNSTQLLKGDTNSWVLIVFGVISLIINGMRIDSPSKVKVRLSSLMALHVLLCSMFLLSVPIIHPTAKYSLPIVTPLFALFSFVISVFVLLLNWKFKEI